MNRKGGKKKRGIPQFHLIVIYAADVKKTKKIVYDFGCIRISIEAVYLTNLSEKGITGHIRKRIAAGERLSEIEIPCGCHRGFIPASNESGGFWQFWYVRLNALREGKNTFSHK